MFGDKIPYVEGLGEEIRTILKGYNIRTVFKTIETLGRILTRVKDPAPPEDVMPYTRSKAYVETSTLEKRREP